MQKVKRKQIDFGGADNQYIKGNGELGLIEEITNNSNGGTTEDVNESENNILTVELLSQNTSYTEMDNEALTCNKTAGDLLQALIDKKDILYIIRFSDTGGSSLVLTQANVSFTKQERQAATVYTYVANLAIYNKVDNNYAVVTVRIRANVTESPQEISNTALTCTGNYLGVLLSNSSESSTIRTINYEQITDSSLGNINIHDGFYFPNAVKDYDGNWYGAVVIGDQVWLAENLKTTHYSDGTPIADGTGQITDATPYYYFPNQQPSLKDEYGLLYNLNAVMRGASNNNNIPSGVQGIAPTGWHIPSLAEFEKLFTYVSNQKRYNSTDDENLTTNKALSIDKPLWNFSTNVGGYPSCNYELNNKTFFGAKPAGIAYGTNKDLFAEGARFKTTTIIDEYYKSFYIQGFDGYVNEHIASATGGLFAESVRCVSDLTPIQFRNWYIRQYGSLQHHLSSDINITGLPEVTSDDNGKILQVVNGVWTLVNPNN